MTKIWGLLFTINILYKFDVFSLMFTTILKPKCIYKNLTCYLVVLPMHKIILFYYYSDLNKNLNG